ncbi:MAG: polymer-forming cytoskeletal protein [Salinibacter sp.]
MFALSLFSNSSSTDRDDASPESGSPPSTSIISEGADIEGILEFTDVDLHIEGTVHGDISTDGQVLVAKGAEVQGTIHAHTIHVAGYVEGHIEADDELVLRPTAEVHATLEADVLEVKPGADFSGEVPAEEELPTPTSPSVSTTGLGSTASTPGADSSQTTPDEKVEAQ